MAYTTDKKSTGLELLTDLTITQADLHIIGDVSDSGRAKAITEDNLEDYIANSDNFIDELTNNANFQTTVNNFVTPVGSDNFTVKATVADTTPSFLDSKIELVSGTNTTVTKTILNPGANEKIRYQVNSTGGSGSIGNDTQIFLGGGYTDSTQYNNVMTFGDYIISAYRDASNGFVTVTQKKDINGGYNLVSNLAIWSNTGAFSSCVTKSSDGTKLYEMSVGGSNFSPWTFTLKEYDLSGSLVNTSTFVTAAGFMFRTDCIGAVVVGNKVIVSAEFNVSVPASGFWTEFTISGASLTTSTATNLAINTSSTVSYFGGYDGTNIYIALGISGNPLSNGVTEYSYSSPNFTTISTFNQPSVVSTTPSPQEQFFNGFEITGSGTIGIYQNISSFDINSAGNFVNTILKAKYNIFTF